MRVSGLLLMVWLLGLVCPASHAQPWLAGGTPWRPFSYLDVEGRPMGIAVDVTRQVMASNNQAVEFVFHPANRLNRLFDEGHLDLNYADSPHWNATDASERFVYSTPYLHVREYLYFRSDHPARQLPLEQLSGLRIGIVRGYVYPEMDTAFRAGRLAKLESAHDSPLIDLLLLQRVDAIALSDDVFSDLVDDEHLDPTSFSRGALLSDVPLVIKLRREHAAQLPWINAALRKLISSGEVNRIRNHYLSTRDDGSEQP